MTYEVKLAVYDLSHGLARSLSAQFLGPQHILDIIPHTAILAFGKEYYFGGTGGIQSISPSEFQSYSGLTPISVTSLGHTTLNQTDFEQWCSSVTTSGEFASQSYDFFHKNCNNFSNEAAIRGLRLSKGVPQWILDIPSRFLASPMGALVRPMLEQMQMRGPGAVSSGIGNTFETYSPQRAVTTAHLSAENPWADMNAKNPWADNAVSSTPIIDTFNKPLLSADVKTIKICTSKLASSINDESSANIRKSLDELAVVLEDSRSSLSHGLLENTVSFLLGNLVQEKEEAKVSPNAMYALMLLRLIVLHPPATTDEAAKIILSEIISIVGGRLIGATTSNSDKDSDSLFDNHAVRAMAWCTISNSVGTEYGSSFLCSDTALQNGLVDAALSDASPKKKLRPEVRQAALTLLYNVAHNIASSSKSFQGDNSLSDTSVSMLCGMLEEIDTELNPTALMRRLMVVSKILKPRQIDETAKELLVGLGFVDVIATLRDCSVGEVEKLKWRELVNELCSILA